MIKNTRISFPAYSQYFFILASIVLTIYCLITIQSIFKPLLAAFIIALLLKPLSTRLEKMKFPRLLSSLMTTLMMLVVLLLFIFFVVLQIKNITADADIFINSFNTATNKIQQWASDHFNIAPGQQIIYLKDSSTALMKNSMSFLQNTLAVTADFFMGFFLFLISLFFFLYYRAFLVSFLMRIFQVNKHHQVRITLSAIQAMVRRYIFGVCIVILTVSTLNAIGLLALRIKHAIFFAVLGGVLTIIPYIGITLGALFPTLMAFATTDSFWYPVGVIITFAVVQFLEGHFITPKVIGSQISLNPFASLLVLFFGGNFFGLLGIILSLPLLAMLKIIFDHIQRLKPLGYLLGNPEARH